MPKTKKTAKPKQKLTPEQRSQVAKDRWAKRRTNTEPVIDVACPTPEQVAEMNKPAVIVGVDISSNGNEPPTVAPIIVPAGAISPNEIPAPIPGPLLPMPQLAPVAPKKQKRYSGPKEFSVALRAAESRLAKAINERAEASAKLAYLQAEIPNLMQIIQALKGSSNPVQGLYGSPAPNAAPFQPQSIPYETAIPYNPGQAALQAAGIPMPTSRAQGGAVQFGPEVVGEGLEGPEDDDDKFLSGPNAGGGWIGG